MSLIRLTRTSLAAVAVLSAALALGGAPAAGATTHAAQAEPVNLYLYVGNGNFVPQVAPTTIYTADGTIIDEQGQPLPAPYGTAGTKYPGWAWSLSPTAASLGWASLNGPGDTGRDRRGMGSAARSLYGQLLLQVPGVPAGSARQRRRELAALGLR
jgi:hypothetical protein